MAEKVILLVEDDLADEVLTLHALEENKIGNDSFSIVVKQKWLY